MLNGKLSKGFTAAALMTLAFLTPALCDSEAGGFVFGGGDSESGGASPLGTGDNQSGGVRWGENESSAWGSGAESDSGGLAEVGYSTESGGPTDTGSETDAGKAPGLIIKNY
jgi:hypothetical protein